jgi:hypothetical protein
MLLHFNKINTYCSYNKVVMLNGTPTVLIPINYNGMSSTKKNATVYLN